MLDLTALYSISFLIFFPIVVALILLFVKNDKARKYIVGPASAIIIAAALFLSITFLPSTNAQNFYVTIDKSIAELINYICLFIDILLVAYIVFRCIKSKKFFVLILAILQLILVVWFELFVAPSIEVEFNLYIDTLSIIMALIIAIIGCGICVYALGYMHDFAAHSTCKDRSSTFFAIMFAFLGAMFAIVFSNNLSWMFCAWEITTVCSFALIGYTRTQEAVNNSFKALLYNIIGGMCFAIALVWSAYAFGVLELDSFVVTVASLSTEASYLSYIPLMLLAIAGFTKAAQFPFQNWLLGAMVAPTPTSALLHSSTMVKAGVFLLIKLSPCFGFNLSGYFVMLIGGVTFVFAAFCAISQSNSKRVLAYSTVSNLGLIVACCGVGTSAAIWAAIFLLVFHAAAKSLLFLCVGTAEHHIGSRDIEDMDLLFDRMPMLSRFMSIGILGMFIAPFGMLVSKWAALVSFVQTEDIIIIILLVFGSAATFMFWAKLLGKMMASANNFNETLEKSIHNSEWVALCLMVFLTVGLCIAFPLISSGAVVPYVSNIFNEGSDFIGAGMHWFLALLSFVIALIFLAYTPKTKNKKIQPVYMSGIGINSQERSFINSLSGETKATQRNWYMDNIFPEKKTSLAGIIVSIALIFSLGFFAIITTSQVVEDYRVLAVASSAYHENDWKSLEIDQATFVSSYILVNQKYEESPESFDSTYGSSDVNSYFSDTYNKYAQSQTSTASNQTSDTTTTNDSSATNSTSQNPTSNEGGE
ncbi:MAG: hypothetical protein MJ189_01935 [Coriobacteriales bacterium]|nr:hypothetical protein [Coriobacteriales bacterium]